MVENSNYSDLIKKNAVAGGAYAIGYVAVHVTLSILVKKIEKKFANKETEEK